MYSDVAAANSVVGRHLVQALLQDLATYRGLKRCLRQCSPYKAEHAADGLTGVTYKLDSTLRVDYHIRLPEQEGEQHLPALLALASPSSLLALSSYSLLELRIQEDLVSTLNNLLVAVSWMTY